MLLLLQVAAALLATGPGDTTQLPDLSPRPTEPLAELRWEPAVAPPADTGRPRAIEYSNAYGVRLTIHRYASYTMLPLFVAEYFAGRDLFNNNTQASSFARNWHRPLATAISGLFVVNTVTGVWNLWDSRHDPAGRTRRVLHSLLMLTADAGFTATGIVASGAHDSASRRNLHRTLAISSMSVALAGDLLMLVWKD
jgi:hypothetical protein